jgi:signal transduction histidine kinase
MDDMSTEEAAREDLCRFMTTVLNHDISNFNQTSRGYLEMLLDEQMGLLTDEQARVLAICLLQTKRIQDLIEAVRLIEELDGVPPKLKTIDLDDVVQEAVQKVQNLFRDREIRVKFSPEGRPARDEGYLTTVFHQLCSNSVRHNESEVVEIDISIAPSSELAGFWKVVVADNGEGVSSSRQSEIFDRIHERRIHGSGFGLPLVQALVTRLGGTVWIDPTPRSSGTAFVLTIPRA